MAGSEPSGCCREVERKFKVPPDIEQRLLSLEGQLASQKVFVDTYYDTEDYFLCLRDHWLRLRSDKNAWELKYRRKEDAACGAATAYREERGDARILETLRALLPESRFEKDASQVRDLVANETLRELAVIKTARRTFKLPGNTVVDIDETDWGFSVGEIEIVLNEADAEALAAAVPKATSEIAHLAAKLGVQDGPPAEGKVESYLRLQRPALYRRLVDDIWPRAKAKDAGV